jgi:REP-associated tyrosine transposase
MPRSNRIATGGIIYHVLNRGVGRMTLFRSRGDYLAFLHALVETLDVVPMRILAFCIMPNHWHLVLWPESDGDLARFMMRLTITHVRRWVEYRKAQERNTGRDAIDGHSGHVYQGRYKSFATEHDDHLANLIRYVERNALRAKLVRRAELWPYSSLGQDQLDAPLRVPLTPWPIPRRRDWLAWVNRPQTATEEEAAIQRSIREGRPYGSQKWIGRTMKQLGWREPLPRGRPKKRK